MAQPKTPRAKYVESPPDPLPATGGSEESFRSMFRRLHHAMHVVAERYLDRDAGADVVQLFLIELHKRWDYLAVEQRNDAYVMGAFRKHLYGELKEADPLLVRFTEDMKSVPAQETVPEVVPSKDFPSPPPRDACGNIDHVAILAEAIALMPKRAREVILRRRDGFTHKQIAVQLGITEATSWVHYARAEAFIRATFESKAVLPGFESLKRFLPSAREKNHD